MLFRLGKTVNHAYRTPTRTGWVHSAALHVSPGQVSLSAHPSRDMLLTLKPKAPKIINDNLRLVYYCSLNDVNIANSVRNLQRMTANSQREFAYPV